LVIIIILIKLLFHRRGVGLPVKVVGLCLGVEVVPRIAEVLGLLPILHRLMLLVVVHLLILVWRLWEVLVRLRVESIEIARRNTTISSSSTPTASASSLEASSSSLIFRLDLWGDITWS
tara:strand:- start:1474 stop:1830 length:357 start_codon:yes stop_codon:yes gene_type:complete